MTFPDDATPVAAPVATLSSRKLFARDRFTRRGPAGEAENPAMAETRLPETGHPADMIRRP